jgi:hypothetical protein
MAIPLTLGALLRISSGFTDQPVEETEDTLTTVPIYGVQTQQPAGVNLQNVYGTAALPMFEFARKVQTGEVKFDPARQFDRDAAEYFSQIPEDQIPQDLQPTTRQIVADIGAGAVGMLASKAGQLAAAGAGRSLGNLVDPKLNAAFWGQIPEAGKSMIGMGSGLDLASNELAFPGGYIDTLQKQNPAIGGMIKRRIITPATDTTPASITKVLDKSKIQALNAQEAGASTIIDTTKGVGEPGFFDPGGMGGGYMPSALQVGSVFFSDVVFGLLSGQKPKKALKSAGFSALGATVGTVLGGPIGGFIGGTLGKLFGGRVVCNELYRLGYLTREQVIDDYRFTRDFLSPQLVRGYHVWAIPVVNQMRKGRMIGFWRHLCVHRAKEIAYIYGKRDKPDYLGKIYRRLLEWPSWTIGFFCKASDWSILYKHKEI